MILLLRQEWCKLYRRYAPYVIYLAVGLIVGLIVTGFNYDPPRFVRREEVAGAGFDVVGDPLNGLLICQFALQSVAHVLPYLAPIVCGELLGGEAATGTLRTILVRPRTRTAIWGAKFLLAAGYTLSLSVCLMGVSLGLGVAVFGWGSLWDWQALTDGRVLILTAREAFGCLSLAYLMLAVAVFMPAALAFALGSFFDNGLAPGFVALGITLTCQIVGALPFDWVERVQPYLFTTYLNDYTHVFPQEFDPLTGALKLPVAEITSLLRNCGAFIAGFALLGWWRFVRKDVTC